MSALRSSRLAQCLAKPCDAELAELQTTSTGRRHKNVMDAYMCGWRQGARCRSEYFIREVDAELGREAKKRGPSSMPRTVAGAGRLVDKIFGTVSERVDRDARLLLQPVRSTSNKYK
jgi:hypothetical protein